ncbi:MAG: sulfurtransferase TusA family protein [Pseudomonadota bacterium]
MADDIDPTEMLDTTGLRCPLPVVKTEALLRRLPAGATLRVLADDPIALVDIPHFAREAGHACDRLGDESDAFVFLITVFGAQGGSN